MDNLKAKRILLAVLIILLVICIGYIVYSYIINEQNDDNIENNKALIQKVESIVEKEKTIENENEVVDFSFGFLKLENQKENKIYSPLSIKYALKMIEVATVDDAKLQISKLIGNKTVTKYKSNNNMSLANALFVRESFKKEIKETYIKTLQKDYDAEVIFDSFKNIKTINSWVNKNTLKLIPKIIDSIDSNDDFILVNALGIDMEWKNKFLDNNGGYYAPYIHEAFSCYFPKLVESKDFDNATKKISGMRIEATINNYDIVKELGEENIKQTVGEEYKKWAKSLIEDNWDLEDVYNKDLSDKNIEKDFNEYFYGNNKDKKGYLAEIDSNYQSLRSSTDFSLYVDENVKVFAKDLKNYSGITLQYIGIMPIKQELDQYVKNINEAKINDLIAQLKEIKSENFKDGVATHIIGHIPKFKFEYNLKLKEDLKKLGIEHIFEQTSASLIGLTDNKNAYISNIVHKANIECTQDGIKAAAVTEVGGIGAGSDFDYIYEIPIEEIDLTFDKPYMFLIKDKKTGEIWFTGTVYDPLLWDEEPDKDLEIE